MQNIPSVQVIKLHNQILKNYCFPYLSFCDAVDDYTILKNNNLSNFNILKCFRAVIFYIEVNVIYPRYLREINKLLKSGVLFENDIKFILDQTNIINYQIYKEQILKSDSSLSNDIILYKYNVYYNDIIKQYKNKLKIIRKETEETPKQINIIGGGKWSDIININVNKLSLYEQLLYNLVIYLKPNNLTTILNIYYVNPNIDTIIINQEKIAYEYKNYFNKSSNSIVIYESHRGKINKKTYKIKSNNIPNLINDYVQDYNIQHNNKLFGDVSLTKFNKIFYDIFNCSFIYFKNSYSNK